MMIFHNDSGKETGNRIRWTNGRIGCRDIDRRNAAMYGNVSRLNESCSSSEYRKITILL